MALSKIFSPLLLKLLPLMFALPALAGENKPACENISPITFGILPFVSTGQLVERFAPLADYLSQHLDVPVRIETAPNFAEFARRTNQLARYQLLFTAPHFYPTANSQAGYRLLVSVDSPGMWAVIVAPKQGQIRTLADLKGKRLATVHPAALATLLVRKHLQDAGINPDNDITLISTPSHDASLLSSYHGVTDASALMSPPFEAASQTLRDNMRIIARTESTPHIPISVSPAVDNDCASQIRQVLLDMNQTAEGRKVLGRHRFSGFRQADPQVYENIRQLLTR